MFKYLFAPSVEKERNYRIVWIVGLIVGFVRPFIKWGSETLTPPWGPDTPLAPPKQIMDHWGFHDPMYTWLGQQGHWGWLLHIFLSITVIIVYVLILERYPRIKIGAGIPFGIFSYIALHVIFVPILSLMPSIFGVVGDNPWDLPWRSNVGEFFSHVLWFWICEEMRHGMRFRLTGKDDPSVA